MEEEPTYQGPMTRSHTQALMKANLAIMIHFGDEPKFKLKEKIWNICNLCHTIISLLKHWISQRLLRESVTLFKLLYFKEKGKFYDDDIDD